MKKYILPILGLAALVACSKTEPVYEESGEIRFAPVTSLATKAQVMNAIDGTDYPTKEFFKVNAYWKNIGAGDDFSTGDDIVTYFSNKTFANQDPDNKAKTWAGNPPAYWPKNGSLRFACYSPSTVAKVSHVLATDTYTVTDYVQPNNTAETIDLMIAPTTVSYDAKTGKDGVAVTFEHALSWISFKVLSDEKAENIFTIKKIVVNDVNTKGSLTAVMTAVPATETAAAVAKSKTWVLSTITEEEEKNPYVMPYDVYNNAKGVVATTTSGGDSKKPVYIENVTGGTVVIPQPTTTVTITFDQKAEDNAVLEDQVITLPLTVIKEVMNDDEAVAVEADWEPGKHYIYTIKFAWDDDDKILINPSVKDWVDVPANVDVDKVEL